MKHPQIAEIRQRETVRLDRKKNMENTNEWGSCSISVTKLCYMSGAHLIPGTHCRTPSSYSV